MDWKTISSTFISSRIFRSIRAFWSVHHIIWVCFQPLPERWEILSSINFQSHWQIQTRFIPILSILAVSPVVWLPEPLNMYWLVERYRLERKRFPPRMPEELPVLPADWSNKYRCAEKSTAGATRMPPARFLPRITIWAASSGRRLAIN